LGSFGRLFVISAKAESGNARLKPGAWPAWLGEEPADAPQLKALLAPYPSEEMVAWPVSPWIGNVKNNDPNLILLVNPNSASTESTIRDLQEAARDLRADRQSQDR
jgi:hypothetical protein